MRTAPLVSGADRARARRRLAALVLTAALPVGLLAACGDDGSDAGGDDAPRTTAAEGADEGSGSGDETTTTAADGTTPVTAPDGGEEGGGLVGQWTADAADILASNLANLGGTGIACTGPVTLSFADDGTFTQQGETTCTGPGGISGTGTFQTTGSYATADGVVTVSDAVNEGTMELMGTTQPMGGGFRDGEAEYEVEGDTLTITFSNETIGTVSQTYARG